MTKQDDVVEALKEVYDPEIPINVVDLGLIYRVELVDDKTVEIDMTLTGMGCPVGPQMVETVKQTALMVDGIDEARVQLVWRPVWDPSKATEEGKLMLGAMGVPMPP